MTLVELSAEQVDALVSSQNRASEYRQLLDELIASDARGADITNQFPGRKLTNTAQSFKRLVSKHREYERVRVVHINKDGNETLALVKS
jgi:uncharacterized lipoprotein NlpE involved in copper resistance